MSYNPYQVVDEFERMVASFTGAKYGVALESATAGLFLACTHLRVGEVTIPRFTYPSVPCSIIHSGGWVKFSKEKWQGEYELKPYGIWDSALRLRPGMYHGGLQVLSFHAKKKLPIGRGGMVLTDDKETAQWFKRMRFDGRREVPLEVDSFDMLGWNMYMSPEQAVRGIQLLSTIDQRGYADLVVEDQGYPDLSKYAIYQTRLDGGC